MVVGSKVSHTKFGVGIVEFVDKTEGHMDVAFESRRGTLRFPYPDIFRDFITAVDEETQKAMIAEIERKAMPPASAEES